MVGEEGGGLFSLFLSSHLSSRVSLSPLSATMTMITRSVGSLCVHTSLTCLSVGVSGSWPIPFWPNMFASCKKQLYWYDSASLQPFGIKWACVCAGNGCCVCNLVVFWLCEHVLVCDSMCCLRCVVGCRRCVGCCAVVTVQKKKRPL